MTILLYAEKTLDKFQHPPMIKPFNKIGVEGTFFKIVMTKIGKPIATIIILKIIH